MSYEQWVKDNLEAMQIRFDVVLHNASEQDIDPPGDDWKKWYYNVYLKTEHWKIVRKIKHVIEGHKCQICSGKSDLRVHHNNYKNLWCERLNDLVVLCDDCHKRHHGHLAGADVRPALASYPMTGG
jgi:hypothetical protein